MNFDLSLVLSIFIIQLLCRVSTACLGETLTQTITHTPPHMVLWQAVKLAGD